MKCPKCGKLNLENTLDRVLRQSFGEVIDGLDNIESRLSSISTPPTSDGESFNQRVREVASAWRRLCIQK